MRRWAPTGTPPTVPVCSRRSSRAALVYAIHMEQWQYRWVEVGATRPTMAFPFQFTCTVDAHPHQDASSRVCNDYPSVRVWCGAGGVEVRVLCKNIKPDSPKTDRYIYDGLYRSELLVKKFELKPLRNGVLHTESQQVVAPSAPGGFGLHSLCNAGSSESRSGAEHRFQYCN